MSNVSYSDTQKKAIENKGHNILVSASAGSGKTTVLIERIINKIKFDHLSIDELLIVTFTEAAASEMKQRLRVKLTKEISSDPNNMHLKKQMSLLQNAYISTFHSFCNRVIQKFFYLIDTEAKYKISEEIETFLIAEESLENLFNELYEAKDETFMTLVNRFTKTTHDDTLKKLIFNMFNKLRTLPFKENYINRALEFYEINDDLKSFVHYPLVEKAILKKIKEAKECFTEAYLLSKEHKHPYADQFERDMGKVDEIKMLFNDDFDLVVDFFKELSFDTFNSKGTKELEENIKKSIKELRDQGKDIITDLQKKYFNYYKGTHLKFIKENKRILESIIQIVSKFENRFKEAKHQKELVDFSDLEEMTLKILTLNEGDNEAVSFFKSQFKEIMIDEYQDTNSIQETIISAVSQGDNIFMVGDVKQSIYRFRNSEPDIFQSKYKAYEQNDNPNELINLNSNYRSREDVIDFINYIFIQLMDEEVGEITYDEKASLVFGQKNYSIHNFMEPLVSLHLLEKKKINSREDLEEDYVKSEMEAHYCAKLIKKMINEKQEVYDNEKGLRPVTYKDIVILSRTKSEQEVYHDVFKQYNIPFLTQELTGYFNSIEVMTMTSILKIIDNPYQDIALVASLRSPIFNINEKELIEIKVSTKGQYYYDKILNYIKSGRDETLINKLLYFKECLYNWREMVRSQPLSELLYHIYHETNYYDFVLGRFGGKQRQANLDLLLERAKIYEHLTSNSLFRFIQLINFLNDHDKDLQQARTVSDNEDLVRFMSIHKSKGLEFPIVFFTNLSKNYNMEDEKNSLLFDKELGISFSYFDTKFRVKYDTIYQSIIKEKMRHQMLAEEMRLLYVAMTRAKERLILVGTIKEFESYITVLNEVNLHKDIVLPTRNRTATNYLDLILLTLARYPKMTEVIRRMEKMNVINTIKEPHCDIQIISEMDFSIDEIDKQLDLCTDYKHFESKFKEKLDFSYSYIERTRHFAKQTISDIKKASVFSEYNYTHQKIMLKTPKFLNQDELSAMQKGTILHQFMLHIDYAKEYDMLELIELRNKLITNDIFTHEEGQSVDLNKILNYLQNDVVREFKNSPYIFKELPFTTLIESDIIYKDLQNEKIMIQGVMDLFVIYNNLAYLIDFKTDRINNDKEALNKIKKQYQVQIDVYKEAMKKIHFDKEIKAYLYLFEIDKFIEM